ncbi:hypothetical protein [Streptomyces sp. NPDC006355]|uniref:hypothetical protein n=1 Tax=Streptomyces sp. NPDC006355 TaxID=3156758 RepID=UPI0033A10EC6
MNYLADAERRANHWYERYQEERRKNTALLEEAKKAKERQLAATRLALKYKKKLDGIRDDWQVGA